MIKTTRRTYAGGIQWIVISLLSLPIFVFGFALLEGGLFGLILWPFWCWGIKKAIQQAEEERFPTELRDSIAAEGFRHGKTEVVVRKHSWSNAPIPLPNKIVTKYTKSDE